MRGLRASRGEASGPPANADSSQRTVRLIVRVAVSPNRRSSREPSGLHEWPRSQEGAGTATHPRQRAATCGLAFAGSGHRINCTIKWQGLTLRPLGRAGRNFPQRRPDAAWHSIRPVSTLFPVGCVLGQRNVRFITMFSFSQAGASGGPTSFASCRPSPGVAPA